MDYTRVFKDSGKLLWRHKVLLVIGLLLMVSSLPGIVGSHLYSRFWLSSFSDVTASGNTEDMFQPLVNLLFDPAVLIGGTIGVFLIFVIVWIIGTIGEAALISGVADFEEGQKRTLGELLSAGTRFLARIIAIDTVIFLPMFLFLLVLLLTLGGGMIGGIIVLTQPGTDPGDLTPIVLVVGIILAFLSVLLIPVTIVTLVMRLVAFRTAVLEDLPTRPSIRRAWELVRSKIGEIIVVALLLYAVSYAVGMITSFLVLPFSFGGMFLFMQPIFEGGAPQFDNLNGFMALITIASLVGIIPSLIFRVFSSAVWTMTYREWQRKP